MSDKVVVALVALMGAIVGGGFTVCGQYIQTKYQATVEENKLMSNKAGYLYLFPGKTVEVIVLESKYSIEEMWRPTFLFRYRNRNRPPTP